MTRQKPHSPSSTADPLADVTRFLGGEYLNAKDVEVQALWCGITAVGTEQFAPKQKGEKPQKPRVVLTLNTDPVRKLSLNATNLQTLIDTWGADAHAWVGRMFEAYFDKTVRNPSGEKSGGLRVRVPGIGKATGPVPAATLDGQVPAIESGDDVIPF